jgi:hypothetical protein
MKTNCNIIMLPEKNIRTCQSYYSHDCHLEKLPVLYVMLCINRGKRKQRFLNILKWPHIKPVDLCGYVRALHFVN